MNKKRILFVCIENSNRSQMAQAFANVLGAGRVEAESAGSHPSGVINPKAIEAMKELGHDLTKHRSKSVEDFTGQAFDYVVGMGCGDACPAVLAKHRLEWQIPDPRDKEGPAFLEIRDAVRRKVEDLLREISEQES